MWVRILSTPTMVWRTVRVVMYGIANPDRSVRFRCALPVIYERVIMSNFRVGDKVRSLRTNHSLIQGQHYTVRAVDNSVNTNTISLNDVYGSFFADGFELVNNGSYESPAKQTKHKHADLIVQWANGAVIEQLDARTKQWKINLNPGWGAKCVYRVKPKEVLPVKHLRRIEFIMTMNPKDSYLTWYTDGVPNVEVTVKPETGEILKIVGLI